MTLDELAGEIVLCLKAGPPRWTEIQQALSPPAKWLVSAARGKRDVGEISVEFRKKFPRLLEKMWAAAESEIDDEATEDRDIVRESISVLRAQISGLRDWKESNDRTLIDAFPAAELHEVLSGEAPAAWKERWTEVGGQIVNGRCVALKKDTVWQRFSEFGQTYEPYDWATALGREDVSYTDATRLGLLVAEQKTSAAKQNLGNAGCLFAAGGILVIALFCIVLGFA